MASSAYGIDLGTCNIKIYGKGDESVSARKTSSRLKIRTFCLLMGMRRLICMRKRRGISTFPTRCATA